MAIKQYIWMDGKFVEFEKATVHVLIHSLHYGSGIFEGIRVYDTEKGPAIFRLGDHTKRFCNSARIMHMGLGYAKEQLDKAIIATVKKNGTRNGYIRPLAYYPVHMPGVSPLGSKVSVAIASIELGAYYKDKSVGLKARVSSWQRINSSTLPSQAKVTGNYANSVLALQEARLGGFDETILLSSSGHVAEGSGDNIFLVENGSLVTPGKGSDILVGITRDSIIRIAKDMGIGVEERAVHREELYTCDELFVTGTAAEVSPVVSVDSRGIGNGRPGPVTKMLSDKYLGIATGKDGKYGKWLTYI